MLGDYKKSQDFMHLMFYRTCFYEMQFLKKRKKEIFWLFVTKCFFLFFRAKTVKKVKK